MGHVAEDAAANRSRSIPFATVRRDLIGARGRTPGMRAYLAAALAAATALVVQPGAADPQASIASADLLLRAGKTRAILHLLPTSDVAGRVVGDSCMTSVVAVTGPDQGPTREG
jgi:hypothetical protein